MIRKLGAYIGLAVAAAFCFAGSALANPQNWQMGLQLPAALRMEEIISFHNFLLWIITAICLFVLALLLWIIFRYNKRRNPEPDTFAHNTLIEVLWTIVPVAILVVIAIPSFRLLYFEDVIPKTDLTIKAIGKQWYWSYEYPDNGDFTFDSLMLTDADAAKQGKPRLLAVDNAVVVPVNTTVRVLTTGADVIHSWALPAFGVKMDAVPGRINETWFKADKVGTYYGECSELCGARHAYMPIEVRVVSKEDFNAWAKQAKAKFASNAVTRVAQAD